MENSTDEDNDAYSDEEFEQRKDLTLSPDVVQTFKDDGVVWIPGAISQKWIDYLSEAIDLNCLENMDFTRTGGMVHLWNTLTEVPFRFKNYCRYSPLPSLAAQLLETNRVTFFFDHLIIKTPGTITRTNWHHDQPYWPVEGSQVLSFWLAMDNVTKENGGLEFIRGSHKSGHYYIPRGIIEGSSQIPTGTRQFDTIPDIESNRDNFDIITKDMKPGDIVAFHSLTLHGAGGNPTKNSRRGYSVRYCGEDTTYYDGPECLPSLKDNSLCDGDPIYNGRRFYDVWP